MPVHAAPLQRAEVVARYAHLAATLLHDGLAVDDGKGPLHCGPMAWLRLLDLTADYAPLAERLRQEGQPVWAQTIIETLATGEEIDAGLMTQSA